jgi:hypothetical protein
MDTRIAGAIELGRSAAGIRAARRLAREREPGFPHNGCAAFLSALLHQAGLADLPVILGAQDLADTLARRGWKRVPRGEQRAGDVAVCTDLDGNGRSDHIFLILEARGPDLMLIVDNQAAKPHLRSAAGGGKTPVGYFLRAPG